MVRRPRYPPELVQRARDKHPDRHHEDGREDRHQQHRHDDLNRLVIAQATMPVLVVAVTRSLLVNVGGRLPVPNAG